MKCRKCFQHALLIPTGKNYSWSKSPQNQTVGNYLPSYEPHPEELCYYHLKEKQGLFLQHYKTEREGNKWVQEYE